MVTLAEKMRRSTLLIWWTNQNDCEAIGERLKSTAALPQYLPEQYESCFGRVGVRLLWVAEQFGDVVVSPWPNTPLANVIDGDTSFGQSYCGIVIRDVDVPLLAELPGIITDLNLRRY